MKKVAFYTLGCKVNQYETQAMCELFIKKGYCEVGFEEKADIYVINTCSVTSLSDRKSRQMIRRAKRLNPNAVVIAAGCYAQTAADEVSKIEGVNLVIGTSGRKNIVELAESLGNNDVHIAVSDIMHTHEFESLSVHGYDGKTRAYIKAQEGCSQFCSYCIIPYARGPIRSRPEEEVISEAKRLAENGFCELVLVGIHIASYGKDLKNTSLGRIICKIAEIDAVKRIRLSSIEPMTLDEEFIRTVSSAGDKLCRHFHISLQSGCDRTLERMNRKYHTADFAGIVDGLRRLSDDVAVTTDVMVGFPGETDEEFNESLNFVKKIGFADLHVFQYSPRPGTPAAKMEGQVDPAVKHERSTLMIKAGEESRSSFLSRFIGRTLSVLFEQKHEHKEGFYEGKTENYITIVSASESDISGRFAHVKAERAENGMIFGKIIDFIQD